jgi:hypothetical protein
LSKLAPNLKKRKLVSTKITSLEGLKLDILEALNLHNCDYLQKNEVEDLKLDFVQILKSISSSSWPSLIMTFLAGSI